MLSLRRQMEEKFKQRARKRIRWQMNILPEEDLEKNSKFVGKLSKTRKPCSCFMCGNPRRYFGENPINERRQEQIN